MNFTHNIIKKIKNKTSDSTKKIAEIMVNNDISKEMFYFYMENRKKINTLYEYYLSNYVNICTYLYKDFKIKEIEAGGEPTDLAEEIKLPELCNKRLKQKIPKIKLFDRFNVSKGVRKWELLSAILQNYEDVLNELEKQTKTQRYKDIDFYAEKLLFEENKIYIRDFSHLEKEAEKL